MVVRPEKPTDVDVIVIEADVSGDYKEPLSYVWSKDNVVMKGETGYKIRLESGVLPGYYQIHVQVTDNEGRTGDASTSFNVIEGKTGIRSDVLEMVSFDPIPDATVSATSLSSGMTKTVPVDSDGKYSIHLMPGHYKVSDSAAGYITESGTFGDDIKVLSPHDEPYFTDCYTTFNFRLLKGGCPVEIRNMAFRLWVAYQTECDFFIGYIKEPTQEMIDAGEQTPYLWENSLNKGLQANGQATKILIDSPPFIGTRDTELTITSDKPFDLEDGYQLALKSFVVDGNKAYLELTKN